MKVSIVIPIYKRRDLLVRCLNALSAQNFSTEDFEIVVADNAGEIETQELIAKTAEISAVKLRYLNASQQPGPAHARNIGWEAASGEIIAFTDDDTLADKNWLQAAVQAFERDRTLAAVIGRTEVPLPENPTDYELNESGLANGEFITANCLARRNVLTAVGGFDSRFTAAWREDSDLHFKLLEANYKIERVISAAVVHPIRPAKFGICLWQQQKSMFDALLYKKHPRLFREKIGFAARRYYLILAALAATVCFVKVEQYSLALAAFGVWLFLTAQFCLLRLQKTSRAPLHVLEMILTSILIPLVAVSWRLRGAIKFKVLFY